MTELMHYCQWCGKNVVAHYDDVRATNAYDQVVVNRVYRCSECQHWLCTEQLRVENDEANDAGTG